MKNIFYLIQVLGAVVYSTIGAAYFLIETHKSDTLLKLLTVLNNYWLYFLGLLFVGIFFKNKLWPNATMAVPSIWYNIVGIEVLGSVILMFIVNASAGRDTEPNEIIARSLLAIALVMALVLAYTKKMCQDHKIPKKGWYDSGRSVTQGVTDLIVAVNFAELGS